MVGAIAPSTGLGRALPQKWLARDMASRRLDGQLSDWWFLGWGLGLKGPFALLNALSRGLCGTIASKTGIFVLNGFCFSCSPSPRCCCDVGTNALAVPTGADVKKVINTYELKKLADLKPIDSLGDSDESCA
jgi:hypothetical protein